jgi:hypothetical protein
MKICPKCNTRYSDDNLNFCLNDGEYLSTIDDSPATVIMDAPRVTDQTNWNQYEAPQTAPPPAPWQSPAHNVQNQSFGVPQMNQSLDQTLPTVSLALGILGFLLVCCYGGVPLGMAAIITGFLGMKNAGNEPHKYGGRGLAIAGLVLGAISLISSAIFILISIAAG